MTALDALRARARALASLGRRARPVRFASASEVFPGVEHVPLLAAETIPTPEFERAPVIHDVPEYASATFTAPAVFAAILPDVLFCPVNNVALLDDGTVIAETMLNLPHPSLLDPHALSARRVERLPGLHTALRTAHNNYFHTLIDNGGRLAMLAHPAIRAMGPLGLLVRGELSPIERPLVDAFRPPHVSITPLRNRRLYRVERYLLVSRMTPLHAGYVREPFTSRVREALGARPTGGPTRKLYTSRAGAHMRPVLNEDAVAERLGRRGFERVFLDGKTLQEQVDLFRDATHVVGPHGAGMTNLLWATDAAAVEVFASPHLVPDYVFLSRALGHRHTVLYGDGAHRDDPLTIDLGAVERALDALDAGGPGTLPDPLSNPPPAVSAVP